MTELVLSEDRQAAILRHLRLDPQDVNTQALLVICQRYGLDPLLKHVVLIQGRPYVTRDGYLHVAHASGQLDGIEVLEEGENGEEWWAKVAVHRKDMGRPFTYRGRYPKKGQQKQYGPEMAVKTAEVMAMRRAFDVTGIGAADEQWDEALATDVTPGVACPKCGTFVAGDPEDRETLRPHLIAEHGFVRLDDGSVVSPDKVPVPSSTVENVAGGEPEGEEESGVAAEATPAPPANKPADVIQGRIDALPDELRHACEDACTLGTDGRWPNEPTEDDIVELSRVVSTYEAQLAGDPPSTGPAAARAALAGRR